MCHNWHSVIMKRLFSLVVFFLASPLVIVVSLSLAFSLERNPQILGTAVSPVGFISKLYASVPATTSEVSTEAVTADARSLLIEKYLEKYHSPLLPYASLICQVSDKYGLDYRLLVAIAQQESNLCKTSDPEWYNCWGWGIHSRGTKTFESYEQAIETVAKGIKEKYCDLGYCEDPCVMMTKYTPQSNGSWCFGINKFFSEIELGS